MKVRECPCGSGKPFEACCGPYLSGTPAPTAEALMRSRYTAYTLADIPYIKKTMKQPLDERAAQESATSVTWIGLEVLDACEDEVEFKASYMEGGQLRVLHERSRFVFEDGRWYYTEAMNISFQ